jgi:hypothetical protein
MNTPNELMIFQMESFNLVAQMWQSDNSDPTTTNFNTLSPIPKDLFLINKWYTLKYWGRLFGFLQKEIIS